MIYDPARVSKGKTMHPRVNPCAGLTHVRLRVHLNASEGEEDERSPSSGNSYDVSSEKLTEEDEIPEGFLTL